MRIDTAGNVGIGTNNPQELLHIDGSSPRIRLRDSDAAGTPYAHIDASDGALLIEADAPEEWTKQNLHYMREHDPVNFTKYYEPLDTVTVSAGGQDSDHLEISTTETLSHQFSFKLNMYARWALGFGALVTGRIEYSISTTVYTDISQTYSNERYYYMQDDDTGDFITNDVGFSLFNTCLSSIASISKLCISPLLLLSFKALCNVASPCPFNKLLIV